MKVLFDHQIFQEQIVGGISRYFVELFKNFHEIQTPFFEVALKYSNNLYLRNCGFLKFKPFILKNRFPGMVRVLSLLNRPNTIRLLQKKDFTVFHPTFYNTYFMHYLGSKPYVLTVYDLIDEIMSNFSEARLTKFKQKDIIISNAAKIITISNNTKRDLIKFYNVAPEKINVIYLANSLFPSTHSYFRASFRYLLFVGGRSGYKNFQFMLTAISKILIDQDLYIICVGGSGFTKYERTLFEKLRLTNRIKHRLVTDSELFHYYKNALAFIFPSRYEGFGIPILESFASECPVIASNSGSLPEVGGNACLYFNPDNKIELAEQVTKIIFDTNLRRGLIENGLVRLQQFSWTKTARQTLSIYESISI